MIYRYFWNLSHDNRNSNIQKIYLISDNYSILIMPKKFFYWYLIIFSMQKWKKKKKKEKNSCYGIRTHDTQQLRLMPSATRSKQLTFLLNLPHTKYNFFFLINFYWWWNNWNHNIKECFRVYLSHFMKFKNFLDNQQSFWYVN